MSYCHFNDDFNDDDSGDDGECYDDDNDDVDMTKITWSERRAPP